jgi:hypothetical protein
MTMTASREEEIRALRAGRPLPADRIIPLRSTGMHAIRLEFIVRLLRSRVQLNTLQVYWVGAKEMMLEEALSSEPRRLVLGWRRRVIGEFPDLWLLCYPDDETVKQAVDREIDRMVEEVRKLESGPVR